MDTELAEIYKQTTESIDSLFAQKRESVESGIAVSRQAVVALYEDHKFSPNAIVDFDKMQLDDEACYPLPLALRIGRLGYRHGPCGTIYLPAILPFTDTNATAFEISPEQGNDLTIQRIFQLTVFRLLLSLPIYLSRFHFVDINSLGRKFNIMYRLAGKITSNSIVSDEKKLEELMAELEQIVINRNQRQLIKCATIAAYNKEAGTMAVPYHFVFITDFPHGFSKELMDRFRNLIYNQNAAKAGIYIFYSIDRSAPVPHGLDISVYKNISTFIYPISDVEYAVANSVFDKPFNDTFTIVPDIRFPDNLESIIAAINRKAENAKQTTISLDSYLENLIREQTFWTQSTRLGIKVPVGKKSMDEIEYFEFKPEVAEYFAMVGGNPGSGKTVLLHNIICNSSIIYSPEELQFYLMDCKDGVGFQMYKNLPHVKSISLNNNLDLILNTLQELQKEMGVRSELFKEATEKYDVLIDKIEDYREKSKEVLPRVVLIIDEFQKLLEGAYTQRGKAGDLLTDLIKRGRSAGIHIIFCTQKYGNVDFDTSLITLRYAFRLGSLDSGRILGYGNESAAQLREPGDAIFNKTGEIKDNIRFKCAYIKDEIPKYVKFCQNMCAERLPHWRQQIQIDDVSTSNLADNNYVIETLCSTGKITGKENRVYLGMEYSISKTHLYFGLGNEHASNLLIIGNDKQAAMSAIALANIQLSAQSPANSRFFLVDFLNTDDLWADYYATVRKPFDNIILLQRSNLADLVGEIEAVLDHRTENSKNRISNAAEGKIVLTLSYVQAGEELAKKGWEASPITTKLVRILKDGPECGIHLILYSYTYEGLFDNMFDTKILDYFDNKVCVQGGRLKSHEEHAIKPGYGIINNKKYKSMPFIFYNTLEGDVNSELHEILGPVFSFCDKN